MKKISKKEILIIIGLVLFIALDQLSKIFFANDIMLFKGIIKFTYVQNTGGAFGIFNTNIYTIIFLNLVFIIMLIRFIILKKEYMSKIVYISLLMLVAGGISNLIDRIFRGYVVDFIDVTQLINFPVFNFADIVIIIGWILLIVGVIKDFKIKE